MLDTRCSRGVCVHIQRRPPSAASVIVVVVASKKWSSKGYCVICINDTFTHPIGFFLATEKEKEKAGKDNEEETKSCSLETA
jgi:hypothetical protein